ncbi:methyl-accepting chemotaxis protein [Cohnella caldifontis]|uniref:methyl-accepting chemotaxis protein n=1 Tax=Cohnella caldifontis TaxID=3027471 RepID=UPI0023EA84E1|nr:methyl-accepting chemotaxis protein [Cohnella sp. YIM B05605]
MTVAKKLYASYSVILVMLAALAVYSVIGMNRVEKQTNSIVTDAIPLSLAASEILTSLVNEETGVRGYLVSGDETFLQPYTMGREMVNQQLQKIQPHLASHPIMAGLIEQAKPQIDQINQYFESQIALAKSGKLEEARLKVGDGKTLFDGFRATHDKIKSDIDKLVNDAWNRARSAKKIATDVLAAITVIALAATIVVAYLLIRSISNPVRAVTAALEQVAGGDLRSDELKVKNKDEIGSMVLALNRMRANLRGLIGVTTQSAHNVSTAAQQISASTEEIAGSSTSQASATQSMNQLFRELSDAIRSVAANAEQAAELSESSVQIAQNGGKAVRSSIEGMNGVSEQMNRLETDSHKIGEIIEVIDDIAEQTNLLALNAAIEAARAGDQGRGFAVVADEVRKLAERSGEATKQITSIIRGIQESTRQSVIAVADGVASTRETGTAFERIIERVNQASAKVSEIAAASEEQSAQAEEVLRSVEHVASASEQSAAAAEETAATSQSLAQLAEQLSDSVSNFKIR